jgi:predicted secreted Zn-dependent protease
MPRLGRGSETRSRLSPWVAIVVGMAIIGGVVACEPADIARNTGPPQGFLTPPPGGFITPAPAIGAPSSDDPSATPEPGPTGEPAPAPTAAPKMVAVPKLTIRIAGAKIRYFAVKGGTSEALEGSVQARSRKDCGSIDYTWYTGDARPVACAEYRYSYRYTYTSSACWVSSVSLSQTVFFPQWTSSRKVPAALLAWWRKWIAVVKKHEAGHVAISRKWLATLRSRMVGVGCSRMRTVFARTLRQVEAAQEAYDKVQYATQVFPDPPD